MHIARSATQVLGSDDDDDGRDDDDDDDEFSVFIWWAHALARQKQCSVINFDLLTIREEI